MKDNKNPNVIQSNGHTFIIQVKGVGNSNWQGTVEWTQTQKKIPFRSALELIKSLDSAITTDVLNN